MTEAGLIDFIKDNDIEWHWVDNNGVLDVTIFVCYSLVAEFRKLLSPRILDDGGIDCIMIDGYFAFWLNGICEYYGVDLDKTLRGGFSQCPHRESGGL